MSDEKPALTPDDFAYLKGMLQSKDEKVQQQGIAVLKTFSPEEQKTWSSWAEHHRDDNSLLGMPPELAVAGGVGMARAAAGGVGSVVKNIAKPILKYEATSRGLEAVGVPGYIAKPIGIVVAGYRGRPEAAAETAPAEMGPARPIIGRGPQGEPLAIDPATPPGRETTKAIRLAYRAAPPKVAEAGAVPAPIGLGKLSAPEVKMAFQLQRAGKTEEEIQAAIQASRDFAARFNLTAPTVAQTKFPKGMRGGSPK